MRSNLINRKLDKDLKKEFHLIGEALDKIVDYGENILNILSEQHKGNDLASPIFSLLAHMLNMVDGISILTKKGSSEGIIPLCRSLFETSLYFEYMFDKPYEKGAIHYQISYVHKEINERKKYDFDTEQGERQRNIMRSEMPEVTESIKGVPWRESCKHLIKFLEREDVRPVNDLWEVAKSKNKRKKYPDNWYTIVSGARNLRELSRLLGKETKYIFIYKEASEFIHGGSTTKIIKVQNQKGYLSLRSPEQVPLYATFAMEMILDIFLKVGGQDVCHWYVKHIRKVALKTPSLDINVIYE